MKNTWRTPTKNKKMSAYFFLFHLPFVVTFQLVIERQKPKSHLESWEQQCSVEKNFRIKFRITNNEKIVFVIRSSSNKIFSIRIRYLYSLYLTTWWFRIQFRILKKNNFFFSLLFILDFSFLPRLSHVAGRREFLVCCLKNTKR